MKKAAVWFISVAVFFAAGYMTRLKTAAPEVVDHIKIQTLSGPPMKFGVVKGDEALRVDAVSTGAGESVVDIPYSEIPGAAEWRSAVWGVQLLAGPVDRSLEATVWYRLSAVGMPRISLGGGVGVGLSPFRVSPVAGIQMWF